ncbi:MAG: glycosyltransferase family 4 protein [Litorimonas sp.]
MSLNILQILPELETGGVERTAVEMTEALCVAGHGSHVLSHGGRLAADIEALGGVNHIANIGSKNILSVPWRIAGIRRLIVVHNIDVVHARSRAPAWPALFAARAENVPFVTTYHGIYNAKSAAKRFYNSIMTKGDYVIANSEFTKAHILKEHKIAAGKITVIPRGVDMARFDPALVPSADIVRLRQSWRVRAGKTLLLLPGRLTGWKGQRVAIAAMATLPDNYHLVCLGDAQGRTEYVSELKAQIAFHDLSDRVSLAGHSSNMPAAYAACDMVICPSTDPEAFGRTAAEAQAMGKPVIASAHGGALETVVHGGTGWLVEPANVPELAAAIERGVIGLTDAGEASRLRILQKFSKTRLQKATLEVYERAKLG